MVAGPWPLANNPVYYAEVLDGPRGRSGRGANQQRWFDETGATVEGLSQPAADRKIGAIALQFIADHPCAFIRASLARSLGSSGGWPRPVGGLLAGEFEGRPWSGPSALGGVGDGFDAERARRGPAIVAPAAGLGGDGSSMRIYWTDMRMQAPLVPAIRLDRRGGSLPEVFGVLLERNPFESKREL